MDVSDYAACDATGLAELIAARQVSAAEVREAALRAIAQVEPELNAAVTAVPGGRAPLSLRWSYSARSARRRLRVASTDPP